MNKEEILRKAQKESNDEMEVQVKDKSMKWTYISMVIAAGIFSFIRESQGYSNAFRLYSPWYGLWL